MARTLTCEDMVKLLNQFLDTVYSPDNPLTARDKLDVAVHLLREALPILAAVREFDSIEEAMSAAKPEDRL